MPTIAIELTVGVLLGLVIVQFWRHCGRHERTLSGVFLVAAGVLYPILELLEGRDLESMPAEIFACVAGVGLAVLGARYSIWFLALGWLLHGPWDLVVPRLEDVSHMPSWYAGLCLGFDLYAGAYCALRAMGRFPVRAAAG